MKLQKYVIVAAASAFKAHIKKITKHCT